MSVLSKLNKKLDKAFDGQVEAREDRGCLVLSGELAQWNDIVRAGMIAVHDNPYVGLVSKILCTGEKPLPIRKPSVNDSALEWEEIDVLIIGGGIIGCAIARELSGFQLSVLLVEKEHDLAVQTTGRNSGVVHAGHDLKKGTLKYRYSKLGNLMFERVCTELGVDFDRCGQYLCYTGFMWKPLMLFSLILRWLAGSKGVKYVGKDELRRAEPGLSSNINSALFLPDSGVVDPFSLTVAYAENAVKNGVQIRFNTMVKGMKVEDGMIQSVMTNRGTVHPKLVINAAGVFCEDIAAMADDRFYSIHPRKGTNLILDKKYTDALVRTSLSSMGAASGRKKRHSGGGGITRTISGNALVGPDATETINKEDFSTHSYFASELIKTHSKTCRELDEKQIIAYFSGIHAATYEEDFVVCRGRYTTNIVHAAGIQSPGLTAAPAIAEDVGKMVVEFFGGESTLQPKPEFDPMRVAPPRPAKMDLEARAKLIEENPDYGIIVCRCEEISKGEILEAMRRNIRCHSLDGIKRRVRPGTGRCQGGFCGPHVLSLIAAEKRFPLHRISKCGTGSELLYGSTKTPAPAKSNAKRTFRSVQEYETQEILRTLHSKIKHDSSGGNRKDENE